MAEPSMAMSFSQTSEDDSSDQQTPHISGGASGGSSSHRKPSTSVAYHYQQVLLPQSKKPRGRPPGSKNKPKPPVVITQDNEQSLKPVIIEVPVGGDVVEAVIDYARRRHVGISVLSGSGSVSDVTLRHPATPSSSFTFQGPFTLLSLNGTYISAPSPPPSPSLPPLAGAASSSSSSNPAPPSAPPPSYPACSSFGISLSGTQGGIFGGVVAGKIVARSVVVVVATTFKNPEFYKVSIDEAEDGNNNPNVGGADGGDQGGSGNNNMPGFNVAVDSNTMNCHVSPSDVNLLQWGHTHSARPANY